MFRKFFCPLNIIMTFVFLFSLPLQAQSQRLSARALSSNVIVPQVPTRSSHRTIPVEVVRIEVGAVIQNQVATTTMDIELKNRNARREEAELIVPVPSEAVVRSFSFQGEAQEPTAEMLPKEEAGKIYNTIVAKTRDPALMEFIGYNLIHTSVFPVEANGTQKVRLTYEQILPTDGNRIDYIVPRSESIHYSIPWEITVRIKSKHPISTVYSPSHETETARPNVQNDQLDIVSIRANEESLKQPGPFRLSYLLEQDGVTASLFAYPDAKTGGGYFLLLAGLPKRPQERKEHHSLKREVTLVLDRSGSMNGRKIEQVREAAKQILAALEEGETFNLITYSNTIGVLSNKPVPKTKESMQKARVYLDRIRAQGGTNIYDALTEALRMKPSEDSLPIVLFLTDGLPTVGQTSEVAIRNVAMKSNPYNRRIFTFGVGVDVNTPLLEKIASETRATATFVLPNEVVEVKVSQVFHQLSGPILAEPTLEVADASGVSAPGRVRDVIPGTIPDLFEGSQLIVTGRYLDDQDLTFLLHGNYYGAPKTFRFRFALDNATVKNSYVPRLWASRQIALMVDAIRQMGANGNPLSSQQPNANDPKVKELVDEIVRLSIEFGILTEYTAFLAREGTNLGERNQILAEATSNFVNRAMNTRTGIGAVNQGMNMNFMKSQQVLNTSNRLYDENMNQVTFSNVQQIADKAFYQKDNRWIESRLVEEEEQIKPDTVIEFGTDEFYELAATLAAKGQQGTISLRGDILLSVDGKTILIKMPNP